MPGVEAPIELVAMATGKRLIPIAICDFAISKGCDRSDRKIAMRQPQQETIEMGLIEQRCGTATGKGSIPIAMRKPQQPEKGSIPIAICDFARCDSKASTRDYRNGLDRAEVQDSHTVGSSSSSVG